MKKLDLYIKVDEKGRAEKIPAQIVEIKKKINDVIDGLLGVVEYIKQKEETSDKGSILQFLDDEEEGKEVKEINKKQLKRNIDCICRMLDKYMEAKIINTYRKSGWPRLIIEEGENKK